MSFRWQQQWLETSWWQIYSIFQLNKCIVQNIFDQIIKRPCSCFGHNNWCVCQFWDYCIQSVISTLWRFWRFQYQMYFIESGMYQTWHSNLQIGLESTLIDKPFYRRRQFYNFVEVRSVILIIRTKAAECSVFISVTCRSFWYHSSKGHVWYIKA